MNKTFSDQAWEDYVSWQSEDRKTLKRINQLLKDIYRNGTEGIGTPEPPNGNFSGYWSRRIDEKTRLVYRIDGGNLLIAACKSHYGDK